VATVQLTQVDPSFTEGLALTKAALQFAAERHAGQVRDGDRAPFVQHPLEVASLLSGAGYRDHVVASGVLHDVLESTETDASELEERFGARVCALVRAVSEDSSIEDRRDRKSALRAQVAASSSEAAAVFAADKVSKARELRLQLADRPPGEEAHRKLDHYTASLSMLERRLGRDDAIVEQLRRELALFGVPSAT
jgi:(p)ppGpp synthase/HD superfamily hydrolase